MKPGENLEEWQRIFSLFGPLLMWLKLLELPAKSSGSTPVYRLYGHEYIPGAPVLILRLKPHNSYVRSISRFLAKDEIRINAIAPGNIFLSLLFGKSR